VAAVHAAALQNAGIKIGAVCDSCVERAEAFARAFGAEQAVVDVGSALQGLDAAIVSSPSPLHYEQAMQAIEHGVNVLVELPPCVSLEEADRLGQMAAGSGVVLQCAHTSRYLEPYQRVGKWIRENRLGEIRQVHYFRCVAPIQRSWTDDAFLHHAAHPLDLFLHWFSALQPVEWVISPTNCPPRDVGLLARLPNGAPASIAISYSAKRVESQLTVIGEEHTVTTDGFSFVEASDLAMNWRGDGAGVYEQAIAAQDREFLRCCETGKGGVPWSETTRMMRQMQAGGR
jgi:2-hydroxy-4-carboxymuconate semialdehyde hemiacetal dehydrogenase